VEGNGGVTVSVFLEGVEGSGRKGYLVLVGVSLDEKFEVVLNRRRWSFHVLNR